MSNYLKVTLENPEDSRQTTEMHFKLLDLDIVDRFCTLINNAEKQNAPLHTSWGMHVNDDKLEYYVDLMNKNIDSFNQLADNDDNIPYHIGKSVNAATLNEIHDLFDHYFYKLKCNELNTATADSHLQKINYHLNKINSCVHMLESIIKVNDYKQQGVICAWLSARYHKGTGYGSFLEPYKDDDYEHFTLAESFGDVYLNYERAGKSISDIYQTNDLQILKNGYTAKPAVGVAAGIIALFGNYVKTHEQELKRFYQWWDNNDISQYGYNKSDKYNTLGYIKLGSLMPNRFISKFYDEATATFDEYAVVEYYSPYSVVNHMQIVSSIS